MESRWFQREVVSEPSSAELVYSLLLTKVGTANAGPVAVERSLHPMEWRGHHDVAPPTF